jgi:hypothetical protein
MNTISQHYLIRGQNELNNLNNNKIDFKVKNMKIKFFPVAEMRF